MRRNRSPPPVALATVPTPGLRLAPVTATLIPAWRQKQLGMQRQQATQVAHRQTQPVPRHSAPAPAPTPAPTPAPAPAPPTAVTRVTAQPATDEAVLRQMAFSIAELSAEQRTPLLTQLLAQEPQDAQISICNEASWMYPSSEADRGSWGEMYSHLGDDEESSEGAAWLRGGQGKSPSRRRKRRRRTRRRCTRRRRGHRSKTRRSKTRISKKQ